MVSWPIIAKTEADKILRHYVLALAAHILKLEDFKTLM